MLPRLDALDVGNRRVFLRVDFNVPMHGSSITDDTRIRAALPTIRDLASREAKLVIASHLGRPKGPDPALSMEPVAARLAELLGTEVRIPDEVVGDSLFRLVGELRAGQIVVMENLRFHPGEEKNDPVLCQQLASLCDAYVNDAFGASHRAHASVVGVPALVGPKAAGHLLAAEVAALERLVHDPARPFVAIVGGAKVSDKLGVLVALAERLRAKDALVIGGAMANTFLLAEGQRLGRSRVEADSIRDARAVLAKARARNVKVVLPVDLRTGSSLEDTSATTRLVEDGVPDDESALDIGPRSESNCRFVIESAATVFWNGPMGVFENPAFAHGTLAVARAVAACPGYTVVGGGDSVAALGQAGLVDQIDHVSTGGGASLEMIEGRKLPGIVALGDGGTA